jgi:competence protein ComEA
VLVLVAFALTVGIGVVRGGVGTAEEVIAPASSATPEQIVEDAALYVHVAGAVARPGLYALPGGSRVVDAIAVAGGIVEGGDPTAVNLARAVADGEQIIVPLVGQEPPEAPTTEGGGTEQVVDLNTADLAELDSLPRIGPALAERILAWRDENGRFASVEDLLAVPGIGEKLLEGVRDRVRV